MENQWFSRELNKTLVQCVIE